MTCPHCGGPPHRLMEVCPAKPGLIGTLHGEQGEGMRYLALIGTIVLAILIGASISMVLHV